MAQVISNSIFNCRLSGSIGDKVFFVRNGKQYIKAKSDRVSRPKTESQIHHGAKFSLVIKFLKPLRTFLREGFKSKVGSMSPFNAAMSHCLRNAIKGTYPDYQIDYPNVLVSKGPTSMVSNPTVQSITEGQVEFSWEYDPFDYQANGNDKVMILVYNPSKQVAVSIIKSNNRMSKSQIVNLPTIFKGDEVHCWIAFHNTNNSKVSDSKYVGSLIVE